VNFELFRNDAFRADLREIYDLREVDVLPSGMPGHVPFFVSRKPFKSGSIFHLPFGFYQTADYFRSAWKSDEWQRVNVYAREHAKNVTLTTLGELDLETGVHCANNPVLTLADSNDPAEKYSTNLRTNLKKEWNKCRRHDIEIVTTRDPAHLNQFYDVLAEQYVREHKMVFQPRSLFVAFMREGGPGSLIVAKQGERVVGGLFLLRDGSVLHYNWGARARVGNVSIGTLLIDFAVRHAKSSGYATFNFGATPLSDSSLLDFKMRWGCDNLPVFQYYTSHRPAQIDLNTSFTSARKLYSKLPIRFAAMLMPVVVPWLIS